MAKISGGAEAVRIERRGLEILNSKSEFSRYRVLRLVINLEEWKSKLKDDDANKMLQKLQQRRKLRTRP